MTSLNPLFTVESQLGETMRHHLGIGRDEAAGALARSPDVCWNSRARAPALVLSASALRRPAPARRHRGGPVLRAEAAGCRRADDSARCVCTGADPEAYPRPRRRAQSRRPAGHPQHGRRRRQSPTASASCIGAGSLKAVRWRTCCRPSPPLCARADRRRAAARRRALDSPAGSRRRARGGGKRAPEVARSHGRGGGAGRVDTDPSASRACRSTMEIAAGCPASRQRPSGPWTASASTSARAKSSVSWGSPAAARRRSRTSSRA